MKFINYLCYNMSFLDWITLSKEEINKQRALYWLPPLEEVKKDINSNIDELLKFETNKNHCEETKTNSDFWIIEWTIWKKQLAIYWWVKLFKNTKEYANAMCEWDEEKVDNFLHNSTKYREELEKKLLNDKNISINWLSLAFFMNKKILEIINNI